jgi:peptide/nickel transport system permease protein
MIPQLLLMTLLIFAIAKLMPGDPFTGRFSPQLDLSELARLRKEAGLDDPWYVQYFRWIGNALHGHFGDSYVLQKPVVTLMGERLGNTIVLSLFTTVFLYLFGIPMAVASAKNEGKFIDRFWLTFNSITYGVPALVIFLFVLFLFGYTLQWFPTSGSVNIDAEGFVGIWLSKIYHVILPSVTIAALSTVGIFTYLRTGLLDNRNQDFVRTARAKGVPEKQIFWKHNFRNSMLPIAQNFGFQIVAIFSGSIFVEQIFNYPGMGLLYYSSISTRDYAVITALMLFYGFLSLVGAVLSDIILAWVDPRVRIS